MPPIKAQKPVKKDIRAFFGGAAAKPAASSSQSTGNGASSSQKSSQGVKRANPIEISDDDMGSNDVSSKTPSRPTSGPPPSSSPVSAKSTKRKNPIITSDSEDEEDVVKPPPAKKAAISTPAKSKITPKTKSSPKASKSAPRKRKEEDDDFVVPDSDEDGEPTPKKKKTTRIAESSDEDDLLPSKKQPPAKKATATKKQPEASSSTPKTKSKAEAKTKAEAKADVDQPDKPKFNWAAAAAAKRAGPAAPGSKPIPEPKSQDCLAGLTFVFTGELSAFSRDEASDLAKRFGGRVTLQPSSKTSYIVLGENAGPSKLAAIQKNNLKTLSEDEFLELIGTRVGPSGKGGEGDEKMRKKAEKERKEIEAAAREMEEREKRERKEEVKKAKKAAEASGGAPVRKVADPASKLWTDRYAPKTIKEICGNKSEVEKLLNWLQNWDKCRLEGFKKPGKDAMGVFRAVMITGPPGIGKTTSAHMCAKMAGYTPIELNASSARSKKLVESGTNIQNTSLDGWMGGDGATNAAGMAITDRTILIMDEVDGMSAGDRGGVGALNALIKKTRIPIICIANDRGAQKLKPLIATTFSMSFRRPPAANVRSRILSICAKEGLKIPANVIDQLITGAQSDIRQVLNMLSTWKLSQATMDFDEGKALVQANEKYSLMTPFNVISKMFGPYSFSPTARETLGEKMELYFHDHQFMGLFVQENYLKAQPARLRGSGGKELAKKQMQLMDRAAASISDGDLVDRMIHGPEQHWSLMPLHSVCSFVRPASFMYGGIQAYGQGNSIAFPQWLGQNSKQNKLQRQLGDLQIRMRLKVSGDKAEIRQSYIPALFPHAVRPLMDVGSSAVPEVIEFMDEYFISREDLDTLIELGVDEWRDEIVNKKINSATKTALTKKYNGMEHPIPFHKATDLSKIKKLASQNAPDLEDAYEMDEEIPPSDEELDAEDDDISKDKLFKTKTKKGKTAAGDDGKAKTKAKGGRKSKVD